MAALRDLLESLGHANVSTYIASPSRDEALAWPARIAVACRCAQEVRELVPDPDA